jgi:hypothetical protein
MGKNVITADAKKTATKEKNLLTLELSEIKDISELIFNKLEKKIQTVEALEAKVDKKISLLQHLMQQQIADGSSPSIVAASLDSKVEVLKDMVKRSEFAGSQALTAIETSMEKKMAAFQQTVEQVIVTSLNSKVEVLKDMVRQSEAAGSRALTTLEISIEKKMAAFRQTVEQVIATTLNSKVEVLKDMVKRSEFAGSQALTTLETSMEKKMAAFRQTVEQSETERSLALSTLEASLGKKVTAIESLIRHEEALQKKIQDVTSRETLIEKKAALLDQLIQKAGDLAQKIQNVESLEVSIDKKLGALELLARRAETVKSHWGGSGRQHEIFSLRQKGLSTAQIAEALDMPQGEVDLTLELNAHQA